MSDDPRERVAKAIAAVDGHKLGQMAPAITSLYFARADAASALIRAETLEEAASFMEQRTLRWRTIYAKQNNQKLAPCKDAAAIRALKDKA